MPIDDMCQSRSEQPESKQPSKSSEPSNTYPDLSQWFSEMMERPNEPRSNRSDSQPRWKADLFALIQSAMFPGELKPNCSRHPVQEPGAPRPSAPHYSEEMEGSPLNDDGSFYGESNQSVPPNQSGPWTTPNDCPRYASGGWWQPHRHSNDAYPTQPENEEHQCETIFRRGVEHMKSTVSTVGLVFGLCILMMFLPKTVLIYGIFISGILSLGLPLPVFLMAGLSFHLLMWMGPFLEVLAVFAVVRVVVFRKPLLNRAYWQRFLTARRWRQN